MFEIGIISIIVLAVGYWVTLWLMGRRDDVLHGDFVRAEPGADVVAEAEFPASPFPQRPSFPAKPKVVGPLVEPAVTKPSSEPVGFKSSAALGLVDVTPAEVKRAPVEQPPASPPSATTPAFSDRSERLQALLASIKRDLKDASQL
jgi:hypothetical protein